MVELVVVIMILGILAVVALPRLSDSSAFRSAAFQDEVVAALRYAQKTAVSHRRLVCAKFAPTAGLATTVTLTIAAVNPESVCSATTLNAPDGNAAFARSLDPTNVTATVVGTVPDTIYFQPSGIATSTGAGTTGTTFSTTVTGMTAITVVGSTGLIYVP